MKNAGGSVKWLFSARIFAISLVAALALAGNAMGDVSRTGLVAEWMRRIQVRMSDYI
ncbi:MAG: hypothetical protein OIN88_16790 [Candidatus Methanoperedens sp.]|nr:hypothetical protein [Candidatus Methanoperedens sp.]